MTCTSRHFPRFIALILCVVLLIVQNAQALPVVAGSQATMAAQVVAAAPVPAEVRTAKKVFVESDASSGNIDMYSRFVAALRTWGYYTIVDSPEKADVIFGFRDLPLEVTVLEPLSGMILWTVSDPLNGVYPKSSKKRASREIENIVSALKEMTGEPLTTEETTALQPVTFRHKGGFVVLVCVLGGLAAAAALVLVLHGRAKEK